MIDIFIYNNSMVIYKIILFNLSILNEDYNIINFFLDVEDIYFLQNYKIHFFSWSDLVCKDVRFFRYLSVADWNILKSMWKPVYRVGVEGVNTPKHIVFYISAFYSWFTDVDTYNIFLYPTVTEYGEQKTATWSLAKVFNLLCIDYNSRHVMEILEILKTNENYFFFNSYFLGDLFSNFVYLNKYNITLFENFTIKDLKTSYFTIFDFYKYFYKVPSFYIFYTTYVYFNCDLHVIVKVPTIFNPIWFDYFIFLKIIKNDFWFFNFGSKTFDFLRLDLLIDPSISNINLYLDHYLKPFMVFNGNVEGIETNSWKSKFELNTYTFNYSLKYFLVSEKIEKFSFINNFISTFFLLDIEQINNNYYLLFLNNLCIEPYFIFFSKGFFNVLFYFFKLSFIYIFISWFLYRFIIFYKNLVLVKKILGIFYILLFFIYKKLSYFLLFLNYYLKNNNYFLTDKINKFNKLTIIKVYLNFDFISYIYLNKFKNSKFLNNYNFLRLQSFVDYKLNDINFSNKFFFKQFIFIFLMYFFLIRLVIYLFLIVIFYSQLSLLNFWLSNFYKNFKSLNYTYARIIRNYEVTLTITSTLFWYFNFVKYWVIIKKNFNQLYNRLTCFLDYNYMPMEHKYLIRKLFLKFRRSNFIFQHDYRFIFIFVLLQRDLFKNLKDFLKPKQIEFYENVLEDIENKVWKNIFYELYCIFSMKFMNLFINVFNKVNIFNFIIHDIVMTDNSLLKYINKFSIKYELYPCFILLKPLKYVFYNFILKNIFIKIFFFTCFFKYKKFEIYFKFFSFYFFNIVFYIFYFFLNYKKIINIIGIYNIFIYFFKIKYIFFIIFEKIYYKIIKNIYLILKSYKFILLFFFIVFYFCINNFFNLIFFNNCIYFYFFSCEFIFYCFESIFNNGILNIFFKISNYKIFTNELDFYSINFKKFTIAWLNLLNEYYLSFDALSLRKTYGINLHALVFKARSIYEWIPLSFIHYFTRCVYKYIWNEEPFFWFSGLRFWSYFYTLTPNFWGLHAKIKYFNFHRYINHNVFHDSIFVKYYLGFEFQNLYSFFMVNEVSDFFFYKLIYFMYYNFSHIYFFFEFCIIKFNFILMSFFLNIILFLEKMLVYFIDFIFLIFKIGLNFYYLTIYIYYYTYLYIIFEKLYILAYTFFFINTFYNYFIFFYNFLFYYQETFYSFLHLDIDFIQKNTFNFKYKFMNNSRRTGLWPTYGFKTKQSIWIDNYFKEYFSRNFFFFELKNLYFFKTFYTFFGHINRIYLFFYIIYLFFLFRIFQYLLSFVNKWFFFTFFNNDWSLIFNKKFGWDRFSLFSKKKSYYFNAGFNHILGGNSIINYFYYYNIKLDTYMYNHKQKYLYKNLEFAYEPGIKKKNKIVLKYNNHLFFENQYKLNKFLWKKKKNLDFFFNWKILSLVFFKNSQFFWNKNLDFIVFKYNDLYGSFNRFFIDRRHSNKWSSLYFDKYNYLFLPPNSRLTYTDYNTKEWLFYKNFISNISYISPYNSELILKKKNFLKYNINYKLKNFTQKKYITLFTKFKFKFLQKNYNEFFFFRLHYPFLMIFLNSKDLSVEKNNNLKYLFPLLIAKKSNWFYYNDLFFKEKKNIEGSSSVLFSGDALYFFFRSKVFLYFTFFDCYNYIGTYNDSNYKGVWNSTGDLNRQLFNNYKGWSYRLKKHASYKLLYFINEDVKFEKIHFKLSNFLLFISQRYYKNYIPFFNNSRLFELPKVFIQNIFYDLKLNSKNEVDPKDQQLPKMREYFSESSFEDPSEPFTEEEWHSIVAVYKKTSFLKGKNDEILMFLSVKFNFTYNTGPINYIIGFIFFFLPFYTFIVDSENYWELNSGFVMEGNIEEPIQNTVVGGWEWYISFGDADMQDERYFFVNILEQEILDIMSRFYQEIFSSFLNYYNFFDYFTALKKGSSLVNDDFQIDIIYTKHMYWKSSRSFNNYFFNDLKTDLREEKSGSIFSMQDDKHSYTFSDLSSYIPFFDNNFNDNLMILFYDYVFFRHYYTDCYLVDIYFFEIFDFFEKPINYIKSNNNILVYKNLYKNIDNSTNIYFFWLKQLTLNNFYLFNIENYYSNVYFYFMNKNLENIFWFDFAFLNEKRPVYFTPMFVATGYVKNIIKAYIWDIKQPPHDNVFVIPFYYNNLYMDIVAPSNNFYKKFQNIESFWCNNNYLWYDYSTNFLLKEIREHFKNSWSKGGFLRVNNFFATNFNSDWFNKIKYLPITSKYVFNYNYNWIMIDKIFLINFLEIFNKISLGSIFYKDNSSFFLELHNLWQFKLFLGCNYGFYFYITEFSESFFYFLIFLIIWIILVLYLSIFKFNYIWKNKKRLLNLEKLVSINEESVKKVYKYEKITNISKFNWLLLKLKKKRSEDNDKDNDDDDSK